MEPGYVVAATMALGSVDAALLDPDEFKPVSNASQSVYYRNIGVPRAQRYRPRDRLLLLLLLLLRRQQRRRRRCWPRLSFSTPTADRSTMTVTHAYTWIYI